MVSVRELRDEEREWANGCYAEIDFAPSTEHDFIVVAEVDGERAGVGRIVPVAADAGELGGIVVFPRFRGQAVARAIVAHLIERAVPSRLYCIPFTRLEAFYCSFGFAPASPGEVLPRAIADKLAFCARYPDPVCLLIRSAA